MRVLAILALSAVALASSAAAQSRTDCTPNYFGGGFSCSTRPSGPPPQTAPSTAYADTLNHLNAIDDRQRAQRTQQQVGQLLAAGRCDDARAYALKAGDFALADYVTRSCAPR